jgi:hypothetical protein
LRFGHAFFPFDFGRYRMMLSLLAGRKTDASCIDVPREPSIGHFVGRVRLRA